MMNGSTNTVWILLVDDHPIVRLGVRKLIASQRDLVIGCETGTAEAALAAIRTSKFDLAIVNLPLEPADGLELVRRLREAKPSLPVLVYSLHDDALFAELAFSAGATGY